MQWAGELFVDGARWAVLGLEWFPASAGEGKREWARSVVWSATSLGQDSISADFGKPAFKRQVFSEGRCS
jgi:hypothetical protein